MKRLVQYFTERSLLVNLFTIGLLIAGLMFLFSAKREAFPKIDFDWVIINTIYPGSTASDVEKYISIPIEDELREVDGIDELFSSSLEGRSVVAVKLDPDLENKSKTINDIKDAADSISDFPEDAEDPVVTELNTAMTPVIEIAISSKSGIKNDSDEFRLRRNVKILQDRILEINGVARIEKKGYRDREMIVEVKPALLDHYHVAINEVITALSRKNLNLPGGVVKGGDGEILIRTIGEVQTSDEIRKVLVRANDVGNWVSVGDIATVRDSFEEEKITNKNESRKSMMLTVIKKESADIITVVDKVHEELESFKKVLPSEYEIRTYNDLSYFVKRRLKVLINNGIVGFILVLMSLFLTLGWRVSLVTAFGIPLAFFATFIWMGQNDVSVNLMSLFGLIMVLGMVVDDAIIVSENVYRHIEEGESVKDAVINGTSEVIVPVAGTIMTTIAAFSPLMFMSGIMGKFVWALPAVVSVALIASWLECMFILPSHIKAIEERSPRHANGSVEKEGRLLRFFRDRYGRMLGFVLKHRYWFFCGITLFFIATVIFAGKNVKFILFPQGNIEILTVKAEAPVGTTLKDMSGRISKLEKIVATLPEDELDTFSSRAGIIQENPTDPYTKRGSNYGMMMIYLTPAEERERDAVDIQEYLRTKSMKHSALFKKIEFATVKSGPPVGKAVSVDIKGDDFDTLEKIAGEMKNFLRTIKGLKDIKDSYEEGKYEYRIHVREHIAAITGISVYDVASTVRSCFEGAIATTIKRSDEEIDIRVNFPESQRNRLSTLKKVKVANRTGNLIPLTKVAWFEKTRGRSLVNRRDWKRVITVTADIDERAEGVSSVSVNRQLMERFSNIKERFPGYNVSFEGEFKDTRESMMDLFKSFIIAALVIYIILVSIFRSLSHPVIIMAVIPLTFIGVLWAFFFHSLPLSFLAIMGMVGLTGVVVNDSIVLMDFIIKSREQGLDAYNAALKAGTMRLRPVFLTTITTFLGLIPTAYGWGGYDPFLKPMAISLSWGLAFGTMITLIGTPLLYNVFVDLRKLLFGKEHEEHSYGMGQTFKEMEDEIEEDVKCKIRNEILDELRCEMDERFKNEAKKKK